MLQQLQPHIFEQGLLLGVLIICPIKAEGHGLLLSRLVALAAVAIGRRMQDKLVLVLYFDEVRGAAGALCEGRVHSKGEVE